MAHFATLDSNNKVINVEVVNNAVITDSNGDEQEQLGIDFLKQIHGGDGVTYKQTSYNSKFRKNFAQIGGTYDATTGNTFEWRVADPGEDVWWRQKW